MASAMLQSNPNARGKMVQGRIARGGVEEEMMSKITLMMVALAIAVAFGMPAHAQPNALTSYETFLAQHPTAAEALSTNPSLYRSPGFMVRHPHVWSYLNQNPALYQSLAAKAPAYSPDVAAYNLSNYLHYHPDIAQTLATNPSVVNNPAYLNQHPDFKGFLNHHPGVQQQLTARGWNFSRWEQTHPWSQRNQWRDADAWCDRDWHQQWERQQQIFNRHREAELAEENEEYEHHDHGKHLGWYKHPGKHHGDADDDDQGGGYSYHHNHHDKHHHGDD
jgi:hypothetical protein